MREAIFKLSYESKEGEGGDNFKGVIYIKGKKEEGIFWELSFYFIWKVKFKGEVLEGRGFCIVGISEGC